MKEEKFSPKIVGFLCNWCAYTGADLAGVSRIKFPPSVIPIRVMCSGRIDPVYLVKAFLGGADAVMIGGCHPGDCHYKQGNYLARRRFALLKRIFENLGLDADRLKLYWISASEGPKFAKVVRELTEEIEIKGGNRIKEEIFI